MSKLITQGAEAKIFLDKNIIEKKRIVKGYRHPKLDEQIRKSRTKHEAKILTRCLGYGLNVPKVLNINKKGEPLDKFDLKIEFISGDKLSDKLNGYSKFKQYSVMKKLGRQVALMHKNNVIHSDLTTSNTILSGGKVYLIDFGLSFISSRVEDKGVDIHLIKQALEAKHYLNYENLFMAFLKGYKWKDSRGVIERLKAIEKRGRYKH